MPPTESVISPVTIDNLTTPEAVQAVIDNPDPVIRNLQITQSYHELNLAVDRHLADANVSWCAFATWASKQAGQFIRNEEVPPKLRRFLQLDTSDSQPWYAGLTLYRLLRSKPVLRYLSCTVEDIGFHLGEGNHLVYTKLAPLFARFLVLIRDQQEPHPAPFDAFLATIERDPTAGAELQQAFTHLYAALFDTDARRKAERIFMSNILIGLHEQTRLQEAIESAVTAPITRKLDALEQRWWLPGIGLLKRIFASAIRDFEDDWQRLVTELLLSLALPNMHLDLSEDLPPLPNGDLYPPDLQAIVQPEANALIAELDYTPHTTRGSGARDWTRLSDRMNYVVDFFRSRQQEITLRDDPFTPEQVQLIRAGRLPDGPL
ncbi:MAG: hypothetical protein OEU26_00835 [Candidatus Tectomicrobia bacterium]|nr:hypothetical protein [Candidatus Tectomicrobia bacterium]